MKIGVYKNVLMMVLSAVILYLLIQGDKKQEGMANVKGRLESQKKINDAYQKWIFGSPKFVR